MKEKLSAVIAILERMEPLYLRVHNLLHSEREALIQLDYEKIYEILVEKDEITSVLRSLDGERLRLQDQINIMLGLPNSDINLRDIAERNQKNFPELALRLLDLRTRVNHSIGQVVERISVNRSLIEKSVKNLQDIAKNFSRALRGPEEGEVEGNKQQHGTYDGKAKYSGPKAGSGSLIRKQL
jgi:hypothetical protein